MSDTQTDDSSTVTCDHCSYSWTYSGRLSMTTCPNCQLKTTTVEDNDGDE